LEVKEKRVRCKGCNSWKELHRAYELNDWEKHKKICVGITGKKKVRIWTSPLPIVKPVSLFNNIVVITLKQLLIGASWREIHRELLQASITG
jgi:hypothetical protein